MVEGLSDRVKEVLGVSAWEPVMGVSAWEPVMGEVAGEIVVDAQGGIVVNVVVGETGTYASARETWTCVSTGEAMRWQWVLLYGSSQSCCYSPSGGGCVVSSARCVPWMSMPSVAWVQSSLSSEVGMDLSPRWSREGCFLASCGLVLAGALLPASAFLT